MLYIEKDICMYVPLYGWGLWLCVCGGYVLTYQTTWAYYKCYDKITWWRQNARSEQFQFTVLPGESDRTQAFIPFRWIVIAASTAILTRQPHAFIFVDTMATGHFKSGRTPARVVVYVCVSFLCVIIFLYFIFLYQRANITTISNIHKKKEVKIMLKKPTKNKLLFVINQSQKLNKSSLIKLGCAVAYIFATAKHYKNKNRNYWNYNLYSNTTSSCVVVLEQL